ncbi:phasin family protein [Allosphingosinicella indica]|uniref:Phasin family protein n=1 Tax=Allosphingosinicella indica TaxID=941907 RepID=A0A1X7GDY3_9SPHN|nr:phasin family protein [Allosphingosinicella indica]SMF68379.1 phasin family protein [Allosphingosinicella indica]
MTAQKKGAAKAKRASAKPVVAQRPAAPAPALKADIPAAASAQAIETAKGHDMNEQIKKTVETGQQTAQQTAERVQAAFGDMNERAKSAMERNSKLVEEMTDLTKGNVEAFVASSRVAAQGFQTLGQEAADFSRRSFEEASATLKSFAEVKSPTDFFRLQSEYARSAFDSMVSESSKMSEAVIKLAGEVAEPITNRATIAADKVKAFAA